MARSRFGVACPPNATRVRCSASGELASPYGLRQTEVYDAVFCDSPAAGTGRMARCTSRFRRAYIVRRRWKPLLRGERDPVAEALRRISADVVMTERADRTATRVLARRVPLMVAWALHDETSRCCLAARRP